MDIRNCRKCGNIFNYVVGPIICPACREKQEEEFQKVKKYVLENPRVSIQQVSAECDVDAAQIKQWIREERLEIAEGSALFINCELCGALIRSGRFCDKCRVEMSSGFRNVMKENGTDVPRHPSNIEKGNPKMRFLQ